MGKKEMIPTYDRFIDPVLRYLAAYPEGAEANVVYEATAVAHGLTPEDREHFAGQWQVDLPRARPGPMTA